MYYFRDSWSDGAWSQSSFDLYAHFVTNSSLIIDWVHLSNIQAVIINQTAFKLLVVPQFVMQLRFRDFHLSKFLPYVKYDYSDSSCESRWEYPTYVSDQQELQFMR